MIASRSPNNDKYVFQKHCGKCHTINRVFEIEKTMFGWERTVDWMQHKQPNAFSNKEALSIKCYLKKIHAHYPEQLFKQRCSKCHTFERITSLRLTTKQWENLVHRERKKASAWIHIDEVADIAFYLSKAYGKLGGNEDGADKTRLLIEQKCLRCHIHATVFKPQKTCAEWIITNERMKRKSPDFITEEHVTQIAEYLSTHNPLPEWE